MNLEKLKYSKCPNCKQRGIPTFKKIGRFQKLGIECKYCKRKYRVKSLRAVVYVLLIAVTVVLVLLAERVLSMDLSFRRGIIPLALIIFIYEYFAPLEEVDR